MGPRAGSLANGSTFSAGHPRVIGSCEPAQRECAGGLEVEDDVEGGLEIVLGLIEKAGVNPIGLATHRKPGIHAEVQSNARLRRKPVAAVARGLGLQVRAADQCVCPRLETVAAAADAESTTAAEILHMLVDVDCWSKTRDDVPLECKPTVSEVADGGVGADQTGVDDVRLEGRNSTPRASCQR